MGKSIQIDIDGFEMSIRNNHDGVVDIKDEVKGYRILVDNRFEAYLPYINKDEARTIADIVERAKYRT